MGQLKVIEWKMSYHKVPGLCSLVLQIIIFMLISATSLMAHNAGVLPHHFQKFIGLVQPEQIHIAFGDTSQDIVIMWATKKDSKFSVEFAGNPDNMQKIEADRAVLEKSSARAAKYLHRVYLAKLKPGEKYFYRLVAETGAASNMYGFKVPYNTPGKVHIFMILADMGLLSNSLKFLTYEAANGMYEALFHVGDIAYNLHRDEGSFGDQFLKHMEKSTAKVPYMTVPGDHERFLDYYHYRYRFSMPKSRWPMPVDQLWYSLDVGPVHFITLNTEVFYSVTDQQDKQMDWLHDDLQKANAKRSEHPWIIVLGHRPMYCSPTDFSDEADCVSDTTCAIRSKLEDLFYEEGVDLYISGHQHNYERSWPLYRGKAFQQGYKNPKAPVHIVNGAMGYQYIAETIVKAKSWSAFSSSDPRKELYGKLEVLNSSHLMWDVYDASNNEDIDSILLVQQRHGPFGKAGDDAYEQLVKLQQLHPAPFHWQPPAETSDSQPLFHAFYGLPSATRKLYLVSLCCTLLSLVICLLCIPRCRRKLCRNSKR
ncbi:hypothetical protein V1264_020356 [Littorina saxatilis]|uniref:Purple acid phosphatase n=3 Tax=Littorina saxatilis TaxID=31220 RepID=A0AAN9BBE7_9CAEN